jgi:hypothetical protein
LSELEKGYGDKTDIHRRIEAIAQEAEAAA